MLKYGTFCRETLKYGIFCRETLKYGTFCRKTLKYALRENNSKWSHVPRKSHNLCCPVARDMQLDWNTFYISVFAGELLHSEYLPPFCIRTWKWKVSSSSGWRMKVVEWRVIKIIKRYGMFLSPIISRCQRTDSDIKNNIRDAGSTADLKY